MTAYVPPYGPSLPDWMRQVSTAFGKAITSPNGYTLLWGSTGGNAYYDGVSDNQAFFGQTQPTYASSGSLGAVYAQRLATYSGGAAGDLSALVMGASRGYNQIGMGVTYAVEAGGLFQADNYSYLAQGVGVYGQANSRHGGRGWGAVLEVNEYAETFTATAGQTVFAVPNGFNAVAAVKKNSTLLTLTTDYTVAGSNVTLTAGASAGDVIQVYRGNPQNGMVGAEIDCFAGPGTDTANAQGGNRNGLNVFAYRQDKSINVVAHVGTVINVIADPSDPTYLIADRGINFQGQFGNAIDFTASNFTASNWLIKFTTAGTGIKPNGAFVLPELATGSVATPASGTQALFIDTADHKLKRKDSSGTVTIIA